MVLFQNCGSAFRTAQSFNSNSKSEVDPNPTNETGESPLQPIVPEQPSNPVAPILKNFKTVVAFGDSLTRGHNPKDPLNTGIRGYVPSLLQNFSASTSFLNCGISSQTTTDARSRYSQILIGDYSNCSRDTYDSSNTANFYNFSGFQGTKPDLILLMLGTNNIFTNNPSFFNSYQDLIFFIAEAKRNSAQVIILSIPPYTVKPGFPNPDIVVFGEQSNRVRNFNNLIQQIAADNKEIFYIDIFSVLQPSWSSLHWDNVHLTETGNNLIANRIKNAVIENKFDRAFMQSDSCQVATGHKVQNQMIICDCGSGNLGTLLKCENGSLKAIGNLNQKCIQASDSFEFINYHCPVKKMENAVSLCIHPVTGKTFDGSLCKDQ